MRIKSLSGKLRLELISVYGMIYKSHLMFSKWLNTHFNTILNEFTVFFTCISEYFYHKLHVFINLFLDSFFNNLCIWSLSNTN